MNLAKPYKYALLAVVFVVASVAGFVSVSSGLLPEYLRDAIPFIGIIVGGVAVALAAYLQKQERQKSD